ncbi:MAG: hypothetical protein WB629_05465 [Candidatus Sulfotelmatobacter sp.]
MCVAALGIFWGALLRRAFRTPPLLPPPARTMIIGTVSIMKIPSGPPLRAPRCMRRLRSFRLNQSTLRNLSSNS